MCDREKTKRRRGGERQLKREGRKRVKVRKENLRISVLVCVFVCGYLWLAWWLTLVQSVVNVKQSSVGWWRPGLVINVDTVKRGQPVDIHYCSLLNTAGATETPTTPGQPHTHRCVHTHSGKFSHWHCIPRNYVHIGQFRCTGLTSKPTFSGSGLSLQTLHFTFLVRPSNIDQR